MSSDHGSEGGVPSRVSVAVCTHEGAGFVGEQLESILVQTRPPDEVVVSDDASTDRTMEIVQRVTEGAAASVRILENPVPRGYRKNFEQAVRACSGDVIFLADQDDVWYREKIESMLRSFSDDDVAIVHCDAVLTDAELNRKKETVFDRHPVLGSDRFRESPAARSSFGIPGCTMAFSGRLIDDLVPFSERWGHDLWITLVGSALGRVVPVSRPLMLYRRHGAGAGPSRYLDTGRMGRARQGAQTRRREDYERDLQKWEEAVQRLGRVRSRMDADDPCREKLETFLSDYRRRLDLARFREGLRAQSRWRRVGPVLRRASAGDYARYLRPVGSPVKDVLL